MVMHIEKAKAHSQGVVMLHTYVGTEALSHAISQIKRP